MERRSLDDESSVRAAKDALADGGIVLYPTDTLYGLAVDVLNERALKRLIALKGRAEEKGISIIVRDTATLFSYLHRNAAAEVLAEQFLPGPLTLVGKTKYPFSDTILTNGDTLAVRIPEHPFCHALAEACGNPFTATSANKSGMETLSTVADICVQFGDSAHMIDVAIDGGELKDRAPSTVVDVSVDPPKVLREDALLKEEIEVAYKAV